MGRQAGFTLIELMIVLSIVAVLAAIALPRYQGYVSRTQATEALLAMDEVKQRVVEAFHSGTPLVDMNSGAGVFPPAASYSSQYVVSVEVVAGVVRARFGNDAHAVLQGNGLVLSPDTSSGTVVWTCAYTDAAGYDNMPSMCRHAP
ncbi:pilin [Marinobacterium marinum]|uniref:Pilin n=1 Tax=Marinobacterium marinum TaxID=2756129 RepID=A0A7W1WW33_9GAMM|nr:pilin [Marinobacterium marinum]MBA4501305.1 pilin [Marinobacterium marinum]